MGRSEVDDAAPAAMGLLLRQEEERLLLEQVGKRQEVKRRKASLWARGGRLGLGVPHPAVLFIPDSGIFS